MPAVPKAGAGAPKRAPAAPAIVEDLSTLVSCPVITAHPNGFVERTEPERETHEVRCVPDHDNEFLQSRQRHIARGDVVPVGVPRFPCRKLFSQSRIRTNSVGTRPSIAAQSRPIRVRARPREAHPRPNRGSSWDRRETDVSPTKTSISKYMRLITH